MQPNKDRGDKSKANTSTATYPNRQADIPASLQKQLHDLARRTNSPIRELNMETINTLKESGYLDFALFQKTDDDGEKNSLPIDIQDIHKAFKIIDEKNNGDKVSLAELKKRMSVINPDLSERDLLTLTNGKQEISAKSLYELLRQNELGDFDPLGEAFKLISNAQSGEVDFMKLKNIFKTLGYGELEKKDIEILYECLDINKDGKITLEDFRELFDYLGRANSKYSIHE